MNGEGQWMQTFTGGTFYPLIPEKNMFSIEDIAHSLSMQCRFNGHTKKFYSVAQHSVLVSLICECENALWGLMHDATEAYLCDLPRPIKRIPEFKIYRDAEDNMMEKLASFYGLSLPIPEDVHIADKILLFTEKRDLMPPSDWGWGKSIKVLDEKIIPLDPTAAEKLFLDRFNKLTNTDSAFIPLEIVEQQ